MRTSRTLTRARGKPPNPTKRTPERVAAFLEALAATGRVTQAAIAAKVGRTAVYAWRKADPKFAAAWDEAEELGVAMLEDEATRRAVEGVTRPLVSGGTIIRGDDGKPLELREYSDTLLAMLLRAKRPERYRERVDVGGKVALSFKVDLGGGE
jgi:hypothetical protein